ncbi:hypothetical protein EON65_00275 [archaeon]|nr:MAG: hypothetical protein EON65_00275 [archaeon]
MNFENGSRSTTGFTGLRNLGNTCYMNSLLQMLFMIPSIRNHLLLANILDPSLYSTDELEYSMIYQLQVVFKHLRYSAKKFYNPASFMRVFGLEHHIQQDACEYFLLLCEKYEQGIMELQQKKQRANTSSPDDVVVDVFKSSFGGKLCNQMFVAPSGVSDVNDPGIVSQLETSMTEHGVREQEEAFNVISLDVKSCGNIRNSLQQFIKYEVIADYEWKENQPRVNIVKRQCISTLSDTVIFHLKRFELNFDTFIREKVNDMFEFPTVLDLHPYTKMGLKGEVAENPEDFIYELCGVVVHMGTSDSGHYYAYLRDTGSFVSEDSDRKDLWHEYNDSEIREFDSSNIAVECFGGTTTSHDYVISTKSFVKSESMNVKNAYMLVYTRKGCVGMQCSANVDLLQQQADPILQEILQDNASHTLCLRTLNRSHIVFYESIVRTLIMQATKANKILSTSIISESIQFLCRYVSHTPYASLYKELFDLLFSYVSKHDEDLIKQHILDLYKEEREHENVDSNSNSLQSGEKTVSNIDGILPPPPVTLSESALSDTTATVIMPPPPSGTELLPASPSLTGTLSSGDPVSGGETRTIASALSTQLLIYINNGFVEFVLSYLSSCNNDAMRSACNHGILAIFQQAWRVELNKYHNISDDDKSSPESKQILTKILTYSNSSHIKIGGLSGSAMGGSAQAVSFEESNMDADLALALKLSQQTDSLTDKSADASKEEISSDVLANPFIQFIQLETFRFVFELTTDMYLNNICEYWRRSNTYIRMLLSIAKIDKCFRVLFIFRDLIAQCVDFVLGEQSPLNNKLYSSNSGKKRAPSSYLNSNNNSNNSKVILKNVPDWTELLELLGLLVRECHVERDKPDTSVPLQERVYMSEWDFMAVTSKTLFSTLIKQARYAPAFTDLAVYLSRDNTKFTSMVCEVLFEELSLTAAENVYYVFEIINSLLLISDSLASQRLSMLFGRSNICILDIMKSYATQGIKNYVVLAVIRSFLTLFVQHNGAFNSLLCVPQSNVYAWSRWMAQFLFKNMSMATSAGKEETKGDAPTSTNTKPVGPAVIVYGEDEDERHLTWQARYEKTYNLLSSILLSWDIDASSLALDSLPTSNITAVVPVAIAQPYVPLSPGPVVQATAVATKTVGDPAQAMELSDCMTDEEFARYLDSLSQ